MTKQVPLRLGTIGYTLLYCGHSPSIMLIIPKAYAGHHPPPGAPADAPTQVEQQAPSIPTAMATDTVQSPNIFLIIAFLGICCIAVCIWSCNKK